MGNGDPVQQKQFYDTMNTTKKEILDAVSTVNGHVQSNSVKLGVVETKLDNGEKRMDTMAEEVKDQKNINKNWNRGLAAMQAVVTSLLVALGISGRE